MMRLGSGVSALSDRPIGKDIDPFMIHELLLNPIETAFGIHPCRRFQWVTECPCPFTKLVTRHGHAFVKRSIVSTGKPVFVYKGTYRFCSNDVRGLRCVWRTL
jgi:hypothetical protein